MRTAYKFYPFLAGNAKAHKLNTGRTAAGAFLIWTACRWLDPDGSRWANRLLLHSTLEHFGVSKRTRHRWIKEALELGFIAQHGRHVAYQYISPPRLAIIINAPAIGRRVYIQEPEKLFRSDTFGEVVLDGGKRVLENNKTGEARVSRATITQFTGIPARTQRYLEKKTKDTKITPNFIVVGKLEGNDQQQELSYQAAKSISGAYMRWGNILVKRGSNSYTPGSTTIKAKLGRSDKQQRLLNKLVNNGQAKTYTAVYFDTLSAAVKQASKKSIITAYNKRLFGGKYLWNSVVPTGAI